MEAPGTLAPAGVRMIEAFDWNKPCAYDAKQKRAFHHTAMVALGRLATMANLATSAGDIRHNQGGIAVSGEITLHTSAIYVQVAQWAIGHGMGILVRTVAGRQDYTGGRNHHFPLALLDDPAELATIVRAIMAPGRKPWDLLPYVRATRGGYTYELDERR